MYLIFKNEFIDVKKMYVIVSGKGGVGKSLVIFLFVVGLRREGFEVGIFDVDIIGLFILKMFGVSGVKIELDLKVLYFVRIYNDIRIMLMNLFLNKEDVLVIWRGLFIVKIIE